MCLRETGMQRATHTSGAPWAQPPWSACPAASRTVNSTSLYLCCAPSPKLQTYDLHWLFIPLPALLPGLLPSSAHAAASMPSSLWAVQSPINPAHTAVTIWGAQNSILAIAGVPNAQAAQLPSHGQLRTLLWYCNGQTRDIVQRRRCPEIVLRPVVLLAVKEELAVRV